MIINDTFNSPFYIFIKSPENQNKNILEKLKLNTWTLLENQEIEPTLESPRRLFHSTWVNGWFHIMDDWNYTLWHDEELKNNLLDLSSDYEIFTCSTGDSDNSFDFSYYLNGKLKREFVVEDPKFNGGEITKDFGQPLKGEKESSKINDLTERVLSIAKNLGIDTQHELSRIKTYCLDEKESDQFIFNDNEY